MCVDGCTLRTLCSNVWKHTCRQFSICRFVQFPMALVTSTIRLYYTCQRGASPAQVNLLIWMFSPWILGSGTRGNAPKDSNGKSAPRRMSFCDGSGAFYFGHRRCAWPANCHRHDKTTITTTIMPTRKRTTRRRHSVYGVLQKGAKCFV